MILAVAVAALGAWRWFDESPSSASPRAPSALTAPASFVECDAVGPGRAQACTLRFESAALGETARVRVLLPPRWREKKNLKTLYFLHGRGSAMGEGRPSMIEELGFAQDLGKSADTGWMIAAPQDARGNDYWMNGVGHSRRWSDFLSTELIAGVEAHFPADPRPCSRLIAGISMGAYGAFYQAYHHPDLYAGAAAHSPLFRFTAEEVRLNPQDPPVFGLTTDELERTLLTRSYARAGAGFRKPLWIDIGDHDELAVRTYTRTFSFLNSLRALEPQAVIRIFSGPGENHSMSYWLRHKARYLGWYEERFAEGCLPAPRTSGHDH
ncbi:MAG: hypothetical protein KF865_03570 [Bdellovibrionaceae bacterium]|nr:hypothetical protein [Pseudobdellovibrionaceae bacterium]